MFSMLYPSPRNSHIHDTQNKRIDAALMHTISPKVLLDLASFWLSPLFAFSPLMLCAFAQRAFLLAALSTYFLFFFYPILRGMFYTKTS